MNKQINNEENQKEKIQDQASSFKEIGESDTDQRLEETTRDVKDLQEQVSELKPIQPNIIFTLFTIIVGIMIAIVSWGLNIFTTQSSRIDALHKVPISEERMSECLIYMDKSNIKR